jgi:hypothetical protein
MGRILFWAFWIVVIFWVISNPHTAAQYVHNAGAFISDTLPHSG